MIEECDFGVDHLCDLRRYYGFTFGVTNELGRYTEKFADREMFPSLAEAKAVLVGYLHDYYFEDGDVLGRPYFGDVANKAHLTRQFINTTLLTEKSFEDSMVHNFHELLDGPGVVSWRVWRQH